MKAPPVTVDGTGVLALVGVAVLGWVVYEGYSKIAKAGGAIVDGVKAASAAVSLDTTLPDAAYADPAAQAQAQAILNPGGDNVVMYYWHKLWPSTSDSTGGATGSW